MLNFKLSSDDIRVDTSLNKKSEADTSFLKKIF